MHRHTHTHTQTKPHKLDVRVAAPCVCVCVCVWWEGNGIGDWNEGVLEGSDQRTRENVWKRWAEIGFGGSNVQQSLCLRSTTVLTSYISSLLFKWLFLHHFGQYNVIFLHWWGQLEIDGRVRRTVHVLFFFNRWRQKNEISVSGGVYRSALNMPWRKHKGPGHFDRNSGRIVLFWMDQIINTMNTLE